MRSRKLRRYFPVERPLHQEKGRATTNPNARRML
jgi:hypothetical protein